MIKCPFCQTTHIDNTIFCNDCGQFLQKKEAQETDPLDIHEGFLKTPPSILDKPYPAAENYQPHHIRLMIVPSNLELELSLNQTIFIGRVDPANDNFPEVDLSDVGDYVKSVSRRHARIIRRGNLVLLEDLGSLNGTFLNGQRLDPYIGEYIYPGDVIQLGKIDINVEMFLSQTEDEIQLTEN